MCQPVQAACGSLRVYLRSGQVHSRNTVASQPTFPPALCPFPQAPLVDFPATRLPSARRRAASSQTPTREHGCDVTGSASSLAGCRCLLLRRVLHLSSLRRMQRRWPHGPTLRLRAAQPTPCRRHSKGDCWLKFMEAPASPEVRPACAQHGQQDWAEHTRTQPARRCWAGRCAPCCPPPSLPWLQVNMRARLSKAMQQRHPAAPVFVQWHTGAVVWSGTGGRVQVEGSKSLSSTGVDVVPPVVQRCATMRPCA